MKLRRLSHLKSYARAIVIAALFVLLPGSAIAGGNLAQHRFALSDTTLVVSFPDHESKEFPGVPVVRQVDINDVEKYDNWFNAIQIFDKYWDYGKLFIPGSLGTLRASGMVRVFPESAQGTHDGPSKLKQAIIQRWRAKPDSENWGDGRSSPVELLEKSINGKEWLYYHRYHKASGLDIDVFLAEIDENHYIEICFDFIDNSRGMTSDWRERAAADETRMMESAMFLRPH